MASIDRGTKRQCRNCSTKFYDLNRDPIVCPSCGNIFIVEAPKFNGRARAEQKPAVVVETEQAPVDKAAAAVGAVVISLQDAEAADDDDDDEAEEDVPDVVGVADVEDIGDDDEDTFLEEDEDDDAIGFDVPVVKDEDV